MKKYKKSSKRKKHRVKRFSIGYQKFLAGKKCPVPSREDINWKYSQYYGWMNARADFITSTTKLFMNALPFDKATVARIKFIQGLDNERQTFFHEALK